VDIRQLADTAEIPDNLHVTHHHHFQYHSYHDSTITYFFTPFTILWKKKNNCACSRMAEADLLVKVKIDHTLLRTVQGFE